MTPNFGIQNTFLKLNNAKGIIKLPNTVILKSKNYLRN